MSVETLNARVFAIFAFCFILVLGLVLTTVVAVCIGLYLGVYVPFGNHGGPHGALMMNLLWAVLSLISACCAFIGSKRAYRVAIKYQEEQKL